MLPRVTLESVPWRSWARPMHDYKKVMRYLRLNSLVPELLDKVDDKKMGFMPAVELSYIKPKNQRLIAVSIDGEQASPSVAQAKKLRELDQEGKLNGDVIDGILSEKKKEDRGVIISTAELEKYFGKEVTPAKMKEQIIGLLDEWKQKQPPELAKAPKENRKRQVTTSRHFVPRALPLCDGSGGIYPPSPGIKKRSRERAVKGANGPAACGGLPFTACPGCAISGQAAGVYPPEPPPFP